MTISTASPVPYAGQSVAGIHVTDLPMDIEAHELLLRRVGHEVAKFGKMSDGFLFNFIGADAALSVIPVVGSVYSAFGSFWLLSQAGKVRSSIGDRLWIFAVGAADVVVGNVPAAGVVADLFLRSHAWSAAKILQHVDVQLALIDKLRGGLSASGRRPPDDHPLFDHVRNALFRNGKTPTQVWIRLGVVVALCVTLLGYCSYQIEQHRLRVQACQMAHPTIGWVFCPIVTP